MKWNHMKWNNRMRAGAALIWRAQNRERRNRTQRAWAKETYRFLRSHLLCVICKSDAPDRIYCDSCRDKRRDNPSRRRGKERSLSI